MCVENYFSHMVARETFTGRQRGLKQLQQRLDCMDYTWIALVLPRQFSLSAASQELQIHAILDNCHLEAA